MESVIKVIKQYVVLSNAEHVVNLDAVKDLEVVPNAAVVPFLKVNDVESMGKVPLVILKLKIRMVSHTKLLKSNEIQNFLLSSAHQNKCMSIILF